LLRSAIEALKTITLPEANEEAGTTKRRVKIKAESEIAVPSSGERAGPAAKSNASTKPAPRGSRGTTGRKSANADKTPPGLLARLGAAAETLPVAQVQAEPQADPATSIKAADPLKATADRLAQLEAEIADLTEAVTAVPTRPAAARPAHEGTSSAGASPGEADRQATEEADDGDDAEITIVGADGVPIAPMRRTEREAPRIFKDGPMPGEEEAEVEIKGDGATSLRRRATDRPGSGHDNARRSDNGRSRGSLGKWRIFRSSN
jgi:hypothetical protein